VPRAALYVVCNAKTTLAVLAEWVTRGTGWGRRRARRSCRRERASAEGRQRGLRHRSRNAKPGPGHTTLSPLVFVGRFSGTAMPEPRGRVPGAWSRNERAQVLDEVVSGEICGWSSASLSARSGTVRVAFRTAVPCSIDGSELLAHRRPAGDAEACCLSGSGPGPPPTLGRLITAFIVHFPPIVPIVPIALEVTDGARCRMRYRGQICAESEWGAALFAGGERGCWRERGF
jgi:hypothetical protein